MLWFIITVVVSPPSKLVYYTPNLNTSGVLVLLDMNLDGFSDDLCATVGSLSIDSKFPLIIGKLSRRALCMLDGGMSRYYPIFGPQTSIFSFVCDQNILIVLVVVEGFISIMHIFVISILN